MTAKNRETAKNRNHLKKREGPESVDSGKGRGNWQKRGNTQKPTSAQKRNPQKPRNGHDAEAQKRPTKESCAEKQKHLETANSANPQMVNDTQTQIRGVRFQNKIGVFKTVQF